MSRSSFSRSSTRNFRKPNVNKSNMSNFIMTGKSLWFGRRNFVFLLKRLHFEPNLRLTQVRCASITGNDSMDKKLETLTGGKIVGWLKMYEDMVGLTEVREAQTNVIQAEQEFLNVQASRRRRQIETSGIHSKLKDIHAQLDKVQRGDKRYLDLLTEEYEIIKQEKAIESELTILETRERDGFAALSSAVRESHEKERARTERTKYWSIMGSIIGVTLGIIGTSINNYLRMRQLKGIVQDSAEGGVELKGLVGELSTTVTNQHNQIQGFVTDLKNLIGGGRIEGIGSVAAPAKSVPLADTSTEEILGVIKKQEVTLAQEMGDIKRMLVSSQASDAEGNIVYVGPEMESLLKKAESNLEWKIKTNALWTITFIYGAFALTLPVLYNIFKGT